MRQPASHVEIREHSSARWDLGYIRNTLVVEVGNKGGAECLHMWTDDFVGVRFAVAVDTVADDDMRAAAFDLN